MMSFGFNLARMSLLVWVAAHYGISAIARWHDPTGISILIACFFSLWSLGIILARKKISAQPVSDPIAISNATVPQMNHRPALLLGGAINLVRGSRDRGANMVSLA